MGEKLFYVKDTYGCYYKVHDLNRLVAVTNIIFATKFTQDQAEATIQTMTKSNQRYHFLMEEVKQNYHFDEPRETRFDAMDTDWIGYLEDLISFCSDLKQYEKNLDKSISEADKESQDILHYIEFNNLNAAEGYKMYKMLRESRLRRRTIKNEREIMCYLMGVLADEGLIQKLKKCVQQIKSSQEKHYTPKVLLGLFEDAS